MRLTLRTLLAWMDEVLAPHDQRALGEKVAASGVAPRLIERVRAAVAHPRLPAPKLDGRGLAEDPNTVADYLDNVLPADQLEAFERICIESDTHLAEVASCHAVLADLSRGAAEVTRLDATACHRLLAAVTTKAAMSGVDVAASAPPQIPPRPQAAASAAAAPGNGDPTGALPVDRAPAASKPPKAAERPRAPLAAWLAATAAVLLLVALGGGLAWSLTRGGGRRELAARPQPVAPQRAPRAAVDPEPRASDAPIAPATEKTPASGEPVVASLDQEAAKSVAVAEQSPAPESPPAVPAVASAPEPAVPSDAKAAPTPPADPPQPTGLAGRDAGAVPQAPLPQGEALVIVAPVPPPPPVEPAGVAVAAVPAPPEPAPVERREPPAAAAAAVSDALLRRAVGEPPTPWRPLAAGEAPEAGEELLAPPWCRPQFSFGEVQVRLEPNTRVVLSRDTQGVPRLEVVFGRVIAWREAGDAALGVTAGGLVGVVTTGPRRPVGIEVALEREPGSDPATRESRRRAVVATGAGEAAWKQTAVDGGPADEPLAGIGPETMLPARNELRWTSDEPAVAEVGAAAREADWLRGAVAAERTQRAAADALAMRLSAGGPLEQTLVAMASDPRAENRMIAVATLALLGEYGPLAAQLTDESQRGMLYEGQWKTLEAMTVPLALARGANAAARLAQAFIDRAAEGDGQLLVTLARGLSAEALADGGAASLVDALDADSLAVRRYAILRLLETAGGDVRARSAYRADRPPALRREGVAWWRSQLERGRLGPPR